MEEKENIYEMPEDIRRSIWNTTIVDQLAPIFIKAKCDMLHFIYNFLRVNKGQTYLPIDVNITDIGDTGERIINFLMIYEGKHSHYFKPYIEGNDNACIIGVTKGYEPIMPDGFINGVDIQHCNILQLYDICKSIEDLDEFDSICKAKRTHIYDNAPVMRSEVYL
jgi:hypothetical protein